MAPREAHPRGEMDSARFRHSPIPPLWSASGPPPQGGPPGSQGWEWARPGQGRGPDGLADHLPELPILTCSCPEHPHGCIPGSSNRGAQIDLPPSPCGFHIWWVALPSFAHSFSKHVQTPRHCTRHQDNNKLGGGGWRGDSCPQAVCRYLGRQTKKRTRLPRWVKLTHL